jgi:hypothetical protein
VKENALPAAFAILSVQMLVLRFIEVNREKAFV